MLVSRTNPSPLSAGASLPKSLIGPTPAYCPIAISRKNTGRPAANSMMTYGICENREQKQINYGCKNQYTISCLICLVYCLS